MALTKKKVTRLLPWQTCMWTLTKTWQYWLQVQVTLAVRTRFYSTTKLKEGHEYKYSNCTQWKRNIQELILQDSCSQVSATILHLLCFCVFRGGLFLNGIKTRIHQILYHSVLPSLLMPSSDENLLLFIKSVRILQLYCTRTSHFTVYESRKQTISPSHSTS